MFDRAAAHSSRAVEFFGTSITPAAGSQVRLGGGGAALRRRGAGDARGECYPPGAGPVVVRPRRSATAAHYERTDDHAVIAIPDRVSAQWALRELVVLHG